VTQPQHVQTSHPEYKLGRLPNDPTKPRLRLSTFLQAAYVGQVPVVVDYLSAVSSWPMALNDRLGCCTASAACHMTEAWSTYGLGTTATPSNSDVLSFYALCSGYNPNDPSTDQGAVMQDCLNIWRKTGIGSHKIAAFAEVNVHDSANLRAALYLFGGVYIGMDFPNSAMAQFNSGQLWDVVGNDDGLAGGHCVHLGYDQLGRNREVTTWGKRQQVTPAFWANYMTEAWVPISYEWIKNNQSPAGLDIKALNAAFTLMTNQPGPFLDNPTPAPSGNTITPAQQAANQKLATTAHAWTRYRHYGTNAVLAQSLTDWMKTWGL
jgi:hypothetical protein